MTLKERCKMKQLSVKGLAAVCQMPYSTMNDIVNGKRDILDIPLRTCIKITNALGISLDELIDSDPLEELRSKGINIYVRNQSYCYVPDGDQERPIRICKVNRINTFFLAPIVKSS